MEAERQARQVAAGGRDARADAEPPRIGAGRAPDRRRSAREGADRARAGRRRAREGRRPPPPRSTSGSSRSSSTSSSAWPASRPTRPRSCCSSRSKATRATTRPTCSSGSTPKRAKRPTDRAKHYITEAIQRCARRARDRNDRVGRRSAERRSQGPHHRPRRAQHPRARARHRRRPHHRRHARRHHPVGLRSRTAARSPSRRSSA